MRIGRTLPPAAAPIGWKSFFSGVKGIFRGESELDRFSTEMERYFGRSHCFLVSSGKAALSLILSVLSEQYPDRDEVIIPAYTCYSVPSAVVRAGLKVKLCDTSAENFDYDFEQLEPMLNSSKLLCVVSIHLFGLPADVNRLKSMIVDPDVTVVEDAAQAMGGHAQGRKLGALGDVSLFSLGRGKAFSTVEGGVILTGCKELAERLEQHIDDTPGYTRFEILKLFLYAFALNIMIHPIFFWIPKSMPFLKLGETIFDTEFKIKKMSPAQAGFARNWINRLKFLQQGRQINTRKWLLALKAQPLKLFVESQSFNSNLIRFPVEMNSEQARADFLNLVNPLGVGVAIAYPNTINEIPQLEGMFRGENYPFAQKHSKHLVTFPLHSFVKNKDRKLLLSLLRH